MEGGPDGSRRDAPVACANRFTGDNEANGARSGDVSLEGAALSAPASSSLCVLCAPCGESQFNLIIRKERKERLGWISIPESRTFSTTEPQRKRR